VSVEDRYSGNEPEPGGRGGEWHPSKEWQSDAEAGSPVLYVAAGEDLPEEGDVLSLVDGAVVPAADPWYLPGRLLVLGVREDTRGVYFLPVLEGDVPGPESPWRLRGGLLERA
jgi:hypothetical protein